MEHLSTKKRQELVSMLEELNGVDSFTPTQAVMVMKKFVEAFESMGLNVNKTNDTGDLLKGYTEIFNLQFYHMPDFKMNQYVLVPNHVSEFDGPLFGALHNTV